MRSGWPKRVAVSAVVVAVLAWCLTGCTRPFDRPVPPEYQTIADQLVADVESLPGVESVEAPVFEVDPKHHAGIWHISLRVRALSDEGLNVIPAALAPVLEEALAGELHVDLDLSIPGGDGNSPSLVGDLSPETLQAVSRLRARPGIAEVNGAMLSPRIVVTVQPHVSVVESIALIRESVAPTGPLEAIGVHGGSDEASSFSVDIATTWPSNDLAVALDELIARGVKHLTADYEIGTTGQAAVSVVTTDPAGAARVLESVRLGPDDTRITRFSVRSDEEDPLDNRYIDGEVGLTN